MRKKTALATNAPRQPCFGKHSMPVLRRKLTRPFISSIDVTIPYRPSHLDTLIPSYDLETGIKRGVVSRVTVVACLSVLSGPRCRATIHHTPLARPPHHPTPFPDVAHIWICRGTIKKRNKRARNHRYIDSRRFIKHATLPTGQMSCRERPRTASKSFPLRVLTRSLLSRRTE